MEYHNFATTSHIKTVRAGERDCPFAFTAALAEVKGSDRREQRQHNQAKQASTEFRVRSN